MWIEQVISSQENWGQAGEQNRWLADKHKNLWRSNNKQVRRGDKKPKEKNKKNKLKVTEPGSDHRDSTIWQSCCEKLRFL